MNIANKLSIRHMRENKGRTVVTVLGICVSVAMITAVFVALLSFMNLFGDVELLSSGNYHAEFEVDEQQLEALYKDDRIAKVGLYYSAGTRSFRLEKRINDPSGTGDFISGDKDYIEQIVTGEYEGVLPCKKGEIAVEKKLIERNGLDWKIGDTVIIPTGKRYCVVNGRENITVDAYVGGEQFRGEPEEYKLTAVLDHNPATQTMNIIHCSADRDEAVPLKDYSATVTLNKINFRSLKVLKDIADTNSIKIKRINKEYLEMHFAFDKNSSVVVTSLLSVTAVMLVLIMAVAVILIYNAFAMSISERIRYLGMLASVGATKKQKRMSVYFESFMLAAIGIPPGIAAGIAGIGITLRLIGKRIIESGMLMGMTDANAKIKTVVPVWIIAAIVLLSLLTVFIASVVPSRKASRLTPIDAIRQTNEFDLKAKRLRSSKLIRLIFGYEGELANKNLKRNGKKSDIITASIALSVILFICCNYFCSIFTSAVAKEANIPYQVLVMADYSKKDVLLEQLESIGDVNDYYCVNNSYAYIASQNAYMYDIAQPGNFTFSYRKLFSDNGVTIFSNVLDDDDFNSLCKANGIDKNKYYGDEYNVILMNDIDRSASGGKVFTENVIGVGFKDLFDHSSDSMTVCDLIDYSDAVKCCKFNPPGTVSVYQPVSQYIKFHKAAIDVYDYGYSVGIETDAHEQTVDALQDAMASEGISYYLNDIVAVNKTMQTTAFVAKVLVYGFITLISLVVVFNIINTISTGVTMRKKEFAMLRSVGTTPKGFNKMIMLESAFYGIKALVFALPLSALLSFGLYVANNASSLIPFKINWPLYAAVTLTVFAVIGVTMLYSVHKLKKNNIIETLKQDIV